MAIREQSSHDPFGEWAKHKGRARRRKVTNGARPAATSAPGPLTGTGSWTPVRTRTRRTPNGRRRGR